ASGSKHVASKPLLLQLWKEGIDFANAEISLLPIWVKFTNVPLTYWSNIGLNYIASSIGRPISVDDTTAKLDPLPFARMCVEVSADFSFPSSIKVAILVDDTIKYASVGVEYQSKPHVCSSCKVFGHSLTKCPKKAKAWVPKNTIVQSVGSQGWTQVKRGSKQAIQSPLVSSSTDLSLFSQVEKEHVAPDKPE
ncbi:DUF4283 domain-containing protein, partial [Modestobacter lapidis]|nr:DUF4283 domain-containing protein [Modestobacter lapidis]